MKCKFKLYLIADAASGLDRIEEALRCGVDVVQLREKDISSAEYLQRAQRMRQLCDQYHTPLIINDRIDIALLCGADGVHLGQEDVPVRLARKILGERFLIGATAKTPEQAAKAQADGADYIGTGAWFPTSTKPDAKPLERSTYREILKQIDIPHVAVGGIDCVNCVIPLENGADGLAVSGGILRAANISEAIDAFRQQLARF